MSLIGSLRRLFRPRTAVPVEHAYALWAPSYDHQPGNLVLKLELEIFDQLLSTTSIEDSDVLDVGCGTGRHWHALRDRKPASLIGVDVSSAMLDQLRSRFPDAHVVLALDSRLPGFASASVDVLISTLTLGHVRDLDTTIAEWCRVLRPGGVVLITDFHPEGFSKGMTRSFKHEGRPIEVENYYHSIDLLRASLTQHHCVVELFEERCIAESHREFFERAGNMHDYMRFLGTPLVFGIVAQKSA